MKKLLSADKERASFRQMRLSESKPPHNGSVTTDHIKPFGEDAENPKSCVSTCKRLKCERILFAPGVKQKQVLMNKEDVKYA